MDNMNISSSFKPFITMPNSVRISDNNQESKNKEDVNITSTPVVETQDSFVKEPKADEANLSEPNMNDNSEISSDKQKHGKIKGFDPTFFDNMMEKVINPRDINDTVTVPRSIFKGYLGFMLGSGLLGTANGLIKGSNKFTKAIKTVVTLASTALMMVGTFEFVKPFMLKEKTNSESENK